MKEHYSGRGVALAPIRAGSINTPKGLWEVTTRTKAGMRTVHLDAGTYSIDTIRAAFPKGRIKRVQVGQTRR